MLLEREKMGIEHVHEIDLSAPLGDQVLAMEAILCDVIDANPNEKYIFSVAVAPTGLQTIPSGALAGTLEDIRRELDVPRENLLPILNLAAFKFMMTQTGHILEEALPDLVKIEDK